MADIEILQQLEDSMPIDEQNLHGELRSIGHQMSQASTLYSRAVRQSGNAEIYRKQTEARLWISARAMATASSAKPTVDDMKAGVNHHPDWEEAYSSEVEANAYEARTKGLVDALRAKAAALNKLAELQSIEMRG